MASSYNYESGILMRGWWYFKQLENTLNSKQNRQNFPFDIHHNSMSNNSNRRKSLSVNSNNRNGDTNNLPVNMSYILWVSLSLGGVIQHGGRLFLHSLQDKEH